jgi:MFS family permease
LKREAQPPDPCDADLSPTLERHGGSIPLARRLHTLPLPHVFYGWWIVFASASIIFIAAGTFFYGFSAIFDSLVDEFGWSRASISFGFSMRAEVGGIFAPLVGYMVDRLGPRKLLLAGVTAVGLGFLWFSRVSTLWEFYAAVIVIALGMASCGGLVGQVAIANWFERKRGRAMAFLTVGAGASGIMVTILAWLISLYGWRSALAILAVVTWVVGIPLAMLVRQRPEDYGLAPDGEPAPAVAPVPAPAATDGLPPPRVVEGMTVREALRSRVFWFLAIALSFSWFGTTAIVVHQIPALTATGFSDESAAVVVTLTILVSLSGRLGFGWLADFRDKRLVLAAAFALQTLGMLLFAFVHTWWHLIPFLLLYAPGYGGNIAVRPALQAEYFGRRALGLIMGLTFFITSLGNVLGPVFVGWMYDVMESYRLAFVITAFASLAAIPLVLSMPRSQPQDVHQDLSPVPA